MSFALQPSTCRAPIVYERVPDVILLDIDLPGRDGGEVSRGKFFRHANEYFIDN